MRKKDEFIEKWFTPDTGQTHGAYDDEFKAKMRKELDEVIDEEFLIKLKKVRIHLNPSKVKIID
mgnify:CR=1 FL=1